MSSKFYNLAAIATVLLEHKIKNVKDAKKPFYVKQMQKKHRYYISNSKPFVTAAAFSFCMMSNSVDDVQSVKIANQYL